VRGSINDCSNPDVGLCSSEYVGKDTPPHEDGLPSLHQEDGLPEGTFTLAFLPDNNGDPVPYKYRLQEEFGESHIYPGVYIWREVLVIMGDGSGSYPDPEITVRGGQMLPNGQIGTECSTYFTSNTFPIGRGMTIDNTWTNPGSYNCEASEGTCYIWLESETP
jgi:hypothetical protein